MAEVLDDKSFSHSTQPAPSAIWLCVRKIMGGDRAETTNLNWLKACSVLYDVLHNHHNHLPGQLLLRVWLGIDLRSEVVSNCFCMFGWFSPTLSPSFIEPFLFWVMSVPAFALAIFFPSPDEDEGGSEGAATLRVSVWRISLWRKECIISGSFAYTKHNFSVPLLVWLQHLCKTNEEGWYRTLSHILLIFFLIVPTHYFASKEISLYKVSHNYFQCL